MKKLLAVALLALAAGSVALPANAGWWRLCGDATHGYQCGS